MLLACSYLLGSIPFGLIASRLKGVDLTKEGSGNIGATNVFRTLGKSYGIAVFVLDLLKGALPVIIAKSLLPEPALVIGCGALAILGHMFSAFMKFKGGKGVATGLGVVLAIAPYLFIFSFLLGITIIVITGYVSLASITGAVFLSILMFRSGQPPAYSWAVLFVSLMVIIKHIPNIKRLIKGTENKISWNMK